MRVLFDNGTPRGVGAALTDHIVEEARATGGTPFKTWARRDGKPPSQTWRLLRRHLRQYLVYYHERRTHLSLDKDGPVPRVGQPPTGGMIVQVPHLVGLHHQYERRAA